MPRRRIHEKKSEKKKTDQPSTALVVRQMPQDKANLRIQLETEILDLQARYELMREARRYQFTDIVFGKSNTILDTTYVFAALFEAVFYILDFSVDFSSLASILLKGSAGLLMMLGATYLFDRVAKFFINFQHPDFEINLESLDYAELEQKRDLLIKSLMDYDKITANLVQHAKLMNPTQNLKLHVSLSACIAYYQLNPERRDLAITLAGATLAHQLYLLNSNSNLVWTNDEQVRIKSLYEGQYKKLFGLADGIIVTPTSKNKKCTALLSLKKLAEAIIDKNNLALLDITSRQLTEVIRLFIEQRLSCKVLDHSTLYILFEPLDLSSVNTSSLQKELNAEIMRVVQRKNWNRQLRQLAECLRANSVIADIHHDETAASLQYVLELHNSYEYATIIQDFFHDCYFSIELSTSQLNTLVFNFAEIDSYEALTAQNQLFQQILNSFQFLRPRSSDNEPTTADQAEKDDTEHQAKLQRHKDHLEERRLKLASTTSLFSTPNSGSKTSTEPKKSAEEEREELRNKFAATRDDENLGDPILVTNAQTGAKYFFTFDKSLHVENRDDADLIAKFEKTLETGNIVGKEGAQGILPIGNLESVVRIDGIEYPAVFKIKPLGAHGAPRAYARFAEKSKAGNLFIVDSYNPDAHEAKQLRAVLATRTRRTLTPACA